MAYHPGTSIFVQGSIPLLDAEMVVMTTMGSDEGPSICSAVLHLFFLLISSSIRRATLNDLTSRKYHSTVVWR